MLIALDYDGVLVGSIEEIILYCQDSLSIVHSYYTHMSI